MTVPAVLHGRSAALGALACAVLAIVGLLLLVVSQIYSGQREEQAESLNSLAAYRAEINARPDVEAAYAQLKARIGATPMLVHGDSGAPAAAQVQTAMKEIIGGAGGEIRSTQVLSSTTARGFEVLAVQYDLTLPADRLRDLAYATETHRPYLFIDSLNVSAPMNWNAKATTGPALELRAVIHAYRSAAFR